MIKKNLKNIIIILIFCLIIGCFSLRPIKIKGNSMYPSLKDGDWVLVNRLAYVFSDPYRGDIIVFVNDDRDKEYFVKRIIGLGEESIEIKGEAIYIDNDVLEETYISASIGDNFSKRYIPNNYLFVLGDNRKVSIDSRYKEVGFVNQQHIIGKIILEW
ncbi:MAG: signal peptidase I [Maledivibacter sp.]|nr:signal peptidase I [Maledivibacter sp.]